MPEPDIQADRTIVIEGPFQTDPDRDDHWAQASIEAHGRQYRVAAVIPGHTDFHHLFGMGDEDREEARGWFALVELAACPTGKLDSKPGGYLPEVVVKIAQAPPLERWVIEDVLNYAHQQLRDYELKRDGSRWLAQPRTRVQPQPAPGGQLAVRPQPQPRLRPQPAMSGTGRNEDRDLKLSRPVKITYDRDEEIPPSTVAPPKKGGFKSFWDSVAGIIKSLKGV